MDFTREPIIETVITPREGYRLVVRSSKSAAQEEHFVDALEVVSFGKALFFRSIERPKPFIVPVGDYEVLEVREPRMVLKAPAQEKAHPPKQKVERVEAEKREQAPQEQEGEARPATGEGRSDRRRDRRRNLRRRRGQPRDEQAPVAAEEKAISPEEGAADKELTTVPLLSSILPPPTTYVRDQLALLREKEDFKGAFFIREDKEGLGDDDDLMLRELRGDQEVPQGEPFQGEPFQFEEVPPPNHPVDKKDMESPE